MSAYDTKKALVDLGFIDGYFYSRPSGIDDDAWWENLMDAFGRVEDIVIKGSLLEASPKEADYRRLLHDLGYIRGWAWQKKIADAVSEAIERVINYFSESVPVKEIIFARPEPIESPDKMVSDDTRHNLKTWYGNYPHVGGISGASGIAEDVVARVVAPIRDLEVEAQIEREVVGMEGTESSIPEAKPAWQLSGESEFNEGDGPREKAEFAQSDTSPGWTSEQKRLLAEMKMSKKYSWAQIGEELGKRPNQCSSMWHWEKKKYEADNPPLTDGEDVVTEEPPAEQTDDEAGVVEQTPALPEIVPVIAVADDPDRQLSDEHWPDIKDMLVKGKSRIAIASDFDVEPVTLDRFIDAKLNHYRADKSPGKPEAPAA